MKKLGKTVFVGLSGGVDSAVSAALLLKQGFEVVGVFLRTWHPEFIECNEEEERRDAIRVAAHLGIPFLTIDLSDEYKKNVADYMITEYRAGRTPNPDVLCNSQIKFGAFLKKATEMGADFVATGHYAVGEDTFSRSSLTPFFAKAKNGTPPPVASRKVFSLKKSTDSAKDQVYFLWQLNQEQLSKIIFPVGGLTKKQVRILAKKFKLPVSDKKDSQGICFLGDIDLKDFLKHYIKVKKGNVVNESGEVIGHHDGALFYTLGERHGFTITKKSPNDTRYYVVKKDINKNTITVAPNMLSGTSVSNSKSVEIIKTNWISEPPVAGVNYTAQIRYHGEFLPCTIVCESSSSTKVIFEQPILVAPGQSIVVYDRDVVLGGGVVA